MSDDLIPQRVWQLWHSPNIARGLDHTFDDRMAVAPHRTATHEKEESK